jgi:hypothetical protein
LVVSRDGFPLAHHTFAGNTQDLKIVQTIVTEIENAVWQVSAHLGHGPRHDQRRVVEVPR